MGIQKTEGIVLRRQELRETSLMLTFYTRGFGKITGLLKGVRGPRAPHGSSALELFAHDGIVFYERKQSDIYTVSQCDLLEFFSPLRSDLERLAYAIYLLELLDSVTALGDKNTGIFELLLNSLRLLEGDSSPRRVARVFEIKLLKLLGIMPDFDGPCANCKAEIADGARFSPINGSMLCRACSGRDAASLPLLPGTIKFIGHIKDSPFGQVSRIKVSHKVGRELEMVLRRFLNFHIGRRLKTLDFLKSAGLAR
ncbi:DNA repair protein RecO [Candidatus Omnitrophota bacterium]